jgi:hypothetical protein
MLSWPESSSSRLLSGFNLAPIWPLFRAGCSYGWYDDDAINSMDALPNPQHDHMSVLNRCVQIRHLAVSVWYGCRGRTARFASQGDPRPQHTKLASDTQCHDGAVF